MDNTDHIHELQTLKNGVIFVCGITTSDCNGIRHYKCYTASIRLRMGKD